jgi:hypothetical protein
MSLPLQGDKIALRPGFSQVKLRLQGLGGCLVSSEFGEVERRLWDVADQLRANSGLKPVSS